MARPRKEHETVAENAVEVVEAASAASKKIKFTAFKTYTSRGRRLADDVDDFPADEAEKLIADGVAVEWH